jgi:hypothetical protein
MHRHPIRTAERRHPRRPHRTQDPPRLLREGHTPCVTGVDRVARSVTDLMINEFSAPR